MSGPQSKKTSEGRSRSPEGRLDRAGRAGGLDRMPGTPAQHAPAAGAHAADHLINDEATPGAGALPSAAHRSGREVDGGAG
jgi:hypothetical protein